jgi:hypothetical protein
MEKDEPFDPLPIRLLRAEGVMPIPHNLTYLLPQPQFRVGHKPLLRCPVCFFNIHAKNLLKHFLTKWKVRNKVAL